MRTSTLTRPAVRRTLSGRRIPASTPRRTWQDLVHVPAWGAPHPHETAVPVVEAPQARAVVEAPAPGYVQVKGGKWHRATHPEPTFMHDESSVCGRTFRPQNVTWNGDLPPARPEHVCKTCTTRTA